MFSRNSSILSLLVCLSASFRIHYSSSFCQPFWCCCATTNRAIIKWSLCCCSSLKYAFCVSLNVLYLSSDDTCHNFSLRQPYTNRPRLISLLLPILDSNRLAMRVYIFSLEWLWQFCRSPFYYSREC